MACIDKLVYFDCKARAEAVRQLYALASIEFCDVRIDIEEFSKRKPGKLWLSLLI